MAVSQERVPHDSKSDLPLSYKRKCCIFQIETLGGEFVTIEKNPDTNKVKILSQSGKSNIIVANVETKYGLVHVIDKLLT